MALLFTEEYLSTLPATPGQSSPHAHLIARGEHLAGYRGWIEQALSFYPKDRLRGLLGRLRDGNDVNSLSAEFEVVWFELLRQWFGAVPEVEPCVSGANPDFRITTTAGSLIVEVATLHEQADARHVDSVIQRIRDGLRSLEHYYWLHIQTDSAMPSNFKMKRLRETVKGHLDRAYQRKDEEGSFTLDIVGSGPDAGKKVAIEVEFVRWKSEADGRWARRPVEVVHQMPVFDVRSVDRTKELLKGKMDQLRGLKDQGLPLLLAVCDGGFFSTGEDGLYHAMFGHDQVAFRNDDRGRLRPAGWQLARDGFFTPNTADGAHYRWVSALAYARRELRNGRSAVWIRLYKNPWALTPLPDQLFVDIPRVYGLEEREDLWRITGDKRTRMYFYLDEPGKAENERVVPPDMTLDM